MIFSHYGVGMSGTIYSWNIDGTCANIHNPSKDLDTLITRIVDLYVDEPIPRLLIKIVKSLDAFHNGYYASKADILSAYLDCSHRSRRLSYEHIKCARRMANKEFNARM